MIGICDHSDFKMDVLFVRFSADLGFFKEASRHLCPYPIVTYPGPRGFLLILSFFIWKFATRSTDRSAEPREKKASSQDR